MTVIEVAGSRLDDWWSERMRTPLRQRIWRWGAPLAVLVLAAFARLWNLGHPHELVFDETYYVKDAWTLMNLGYEGSWPAEPNPAFNRGEVDTYLDAPSFIAHPPLGKWIIAIGLALFGAESSVGWRIGVAVCGILLVAVTMLVAHLLFRSTLLTAIAGGLLAIDGMGIVMSRVALLDTMLALFALLGVAAVLQDRLGGERRLADWIARREAADRHTDWGPAFWRRPWLLAAGLAFGLAGGVKWNAIYFLAVLAVYALVTEILERRRAGIAFWLGGTVLRQGPVTFVLVVPIAIVVYVATWIGWFATDDGYYRHWAEETPGGPWTGGLAWVPLPIQNWWHYQAAMYGYHVNEDTPHPYQANPLTWLLLVRPTSMYWSADEQRGTAETILGVGNPLIWWAGAAAAVFLLVRVIRGLVRRTVVWREAFILVALGAGYLPWMMYLHRTAFQFYTIAFAPYLVLGLTAVLALVMGRSTDTTSRRVSGLTLVAAFGAACLALSIYFFPIWTGTEIPRWLMTAHFWFPSWV